MRNYFENDIELNPNQIKNFVNDKKNVGYVNKNLEKV